jgi:hypothetical protein
MSRYAYKLFSDDIATFIKNGRLMLYSTLALGVLLVASPAQAVDDPTHYIAGQSCSDFGVTHLTDDSTNIVACLYTDATNTALVWEVQYSGGNTGGGSYITISGGGIPPGACTGGNPLASYRCSCPSGFVASPVSFWQSADNSLQIIGYICNQQ